METAVQLTAAICGRIDRSISGRLHELTQLYRLLHMLHTNQRLWHARLSLLVILLSTTMTLMSSLTYIYPASIIDNKHDRIPNVCLSYIITLISSVLKWGGWEERCNDTKAQASKITDALGALRRMQHSWKERPREDTAMPVEKYDAIQGVLERALQVSIESKSVLFALKPAMVADYERHILHTSLHRQHTEVSKEMASQFQQLIDGYKRNGDSALTPEALNELVAIQQQSLKAHAELMYLADVKSPWYKRLGKWCWRHRPGRQRRHVIEC